MVDCICYCAIELLFIVWMALRSRLLIRRDSENTEIKWASFLRPYDWDVWLAIPVTIFFGMLTLLVCITYSGIEQNPAELSWMLSCCFLLQGKHYANVIVWIHLPIQDNFYFAGQTEHTFMSNGPCRITLGTFWLLSIFIYSCYTARLTSFLADNSEQLPIKSLSEAVRNTNWKVGGMGGSSFIEKLKVFISFLIS